MTEKIGIIDLGTNTFHLLLAEVRGHTSRIFYRERQAVKIGRGGINQGVITEDALERALTCIHHFKNVIDREKVFRVQAFATSAFRSAANGQEVIRKIRLQTGIEVDMISGDQEAEYIYHGVRTAMDLRQENSLIVDIGGGSVEFIIGNGENFIWKNSFDIGAQRLLEQYQKHDPMLPREIVDLQNHYELCLRPLHEAMQQFNPRILVGSSGTFDTLSEIYCNRNHIVYSTEATESPLTIPGFYEIHNEIIGKNRAERMNMKGMIEMRVDMIVVASCLIHYLLTHFVFNNIRVSAYSLKEGALARLAEL